MDLLLEMNVALWGYLLPMFEVMQNLGNLVYHIEI